MSPGLRGDHTPGRPHASLPGAYSPLTPPTESSSHIFKR